MRGSLLELLYHNKPNQALIFGLLGPKGQEMLVLVLLLLGDQGLSQTVVTTSMPSSMPTPVPSSLPTPGPTALCGETTDDGCWMRSTYPCYETKSHDEKLEILLDLLETEDYVPAWPKDAEARLAAADFSQVFLWDCDSRPASIPKHTNIVGAVAHASFEPLSNNYTGFFQGAESMVVRLAPIIEPLALDDPVAARFVPGLGVKILRTNTTSGNVVFSRDGAPVPGKWSWNYFEKPMSNHLSARGPIPTPLGYGVAEKTVGAAPFYFGYVGISDLATYDQDGLEVDAPKFPFQLILDPNTVDLNFPTTFTDRNHIVDQAPTIPVDTLLWRVYAIDSPIAETTDYIGDIVLRSNFTSSRFGDDVLFFRHQLFDDDLALRPDFRNLGPGSCSSSSCDVVCPYDTPCPPRPCPSVTNASSCPFL